MTTDHKAQVEAARIECHKARRETCGAWSNVMTGPHAILPDDLDAKCDKAQASEAVLREAIDQLAALASAPPAPAASEPLTDKQIIDMTTWQFPRWQVDIQTKFVLFLARAVEDAHGIRKKIS